MKSVSCQNNTPQDGDRRRQESKPYNELSEVRCFTSCFLNLGSCHVRVQPSCESSVNADQNPVIIRGLDKSLVLSLVHRSVRYNGRAQLKWAGKRQTESDPTKRPRPAKFPLAGTATPDQRRRTAGLTTLENGPRPFSAVALGYVPTHSLNNAPSSN